MMAEGLPTTPTEFDCHALLDRTKDEEVSPTRSRTESSGSWSSSSSSSYVCQYCPYTSNRRNNVHRHETTMHCTKMSETCCNITFTSKAAFQTHCYYHHKESGYHCPECDTSFSRRALLKRHSSVHTGVKPYSCSDCFYRTSHKSNLWRHRKHKHDATSPGNENEQLSVVEEVPDSLDQIAIEVALFLATWKSSQ